ncbi:heme ABC exporter ATP-binding protein CcmA [Roseiarcaceae bacterium H3SJ34-1]|nr:heme ABC exporter ATP-binding protein CcmA [Roseiarcaceae bacterium H3SJ34-1]
MPESTPSSSASSSLWPAALVLRVADVDVARGERLLAGGLSFDVRAGEALTITGPNGAGKSTFLRMLAGLLPVARGRITLEGAEADTPVAAQAHYLGHLNALKPALSVRENLAFWADTLGQGGAALSPAAALAAFGLAHVLDVPGGYLSTGQKRRVALARLLVAQRPLWLLDEPSAGLDAGAQAQLSAVMGRHLAAGGMIVAATHVPLGLDGAVEIHLGGDAA